MNVVTIVGRNYLPQARVLAATFKQHHPHGTAYVFVLDGPGGELGPHLQGLSLADLDMSPAEFRTRTIVYDVVELATAMKAAVLRSVIRRTGEPAVYLDPDIAVYAPLDDLVDHARDHGIVLTPHSLSPLPEGAALEDKGLLVAGAFNLGCIGVGPTAMDFLAWWDQRLARHCLFSPNDGLFFDQRWLDLAVHYFPAFVLRDPGVNVAWWNLATRSVWRHEGYYADRAPLRLFHWSGYDPLTPHLLRNRSGTAPIDMPQGPVAELSAGYRQSLLAEGYASEISQYRYGIAADGSPITRAIRRSYRDELLGGQDGLPDPFDPADASAYAKWSSRVRRVERIHDALRATISRSRSIATRSRTLRLLNSVRRQA